jgi:hypothetical protein
MLELVTACLLGTIVGLLMRKAPSRRGFFKINKYLMSCDTIAFLGAP